MTEEHVTEAKGSAPASESEDWDLENDEEIRAIRRRQRLTTFGIIGTFVALIGVIPMAFGFGPFASRLLLSSDADIHVLNTSGHALKIEASFATRPLEIGSGHLDSLRSLTGPITIVATDFDTGEELERLDIVAEGPLLYNALGSECLVVFDLTELYGGGGEGELRILERIPQEQRIVHIRSDAVVLPRRPNPPQARGVVHWIEDFSCQLVFMDDDTLLLARAEMRMRERWERMQEYREAVRESMGGGQ